MIVWEILNEGPIRRYGEADPPKSLKRLYVSREKAESVVEKIVERYHKSVVKEMQDISRNEEDVEDYGLDKEDIDWWKSNPPVRVYRTKTETFFGCGDPKWDSRDSRGRAYGWVKCREVVE